MDTVNMNEMDTVNMNEMDTVNMNEMDTVNMNEMDTVNMNDTPNNITADLLLKLTISKENLTEKIELVTNYPFLLPILYINHNEKDKILDELETLYGSSIDNNIVYKWITSKKDSCSYTSLSEFNYLYGFTFDVGSVDSLIIYKNIKELSKDYSYLLISLRYGLDKQESIIMYNEIPKMNIKLLNKDELEKYLPYKQVIQNNNHKEKYITIENKNSENNWKIGIDYGNDYCLLCNEVLNKNELDNIVNGELCTKNISKLVENMFNKYILSNIQVNEKENIETYNKTIESISRLPFSENPDEYILIVQNHFKNILHETDYKYFCIYLEYIKELEVWDISNVIKYIKEYFGNL